MIGRRVKPFQGEPGEVIRWEPLGSAMCDALVRYDSGREVWHASHSCKPIDGLGPPDSREELQSTNEKWSLLMLKEIRRQHVANFGQPWPGMEFGKTIFGNMVDGAIKDLEAKVKNE